jgi:hypothetical protein
VSFQDDGFEYGFAGAEQVVWCIRRTGEAWTLCSRKVVSAKATGFFPAAQPTTRPSPVCGGCLLVLFGVRRERRVPS